jgi:rhodanese-related sulfurtransferase
MIKRFTACVLLILILIFGFVYPSLSLQDNKTIVNISSKAASDLIAKNKGDSRFIILDIRTPGEFKAGHLPNSTQIDYYSKTFADKIKQLDKSKTYLIYCRSGNRSARSLQLFKKLKFQKVYHMDSGIIGWKSEGLPIIK